VSAGKRASIPLLPGVELRQLAQALESMRTQLEGKAYVERYVQTLTHELKSPLAAIAGATELLHGDMRAEQRERFLKNIETETTRLQSLSERLLHLAHVEQRRGLEERVPIELRALVDELLHAQLPRLQSGGIQAQNQVPAPTIVVGERFLVRQALANLVDNAVDFTRQGGTLRIDIQPHDEGGAAALVVRVFNEGDPIPDYALPRVTERFYSLPRPATGRKSTGLGLSFVCEAAHLHDGAFQILNVERGVEAQLRLPIR
jgi:two-component system sensor histidine kinase CreC